MLELAAVFADLRRTSNPSLNCISSAFLIRSCFYRWSSKSACLPLTAKKLMSSFDICYCLGAFFDFDFGRVTRPRISVEMPRN